jgi:prepilin-type N-terminal cleavage/methylation domain-containing protein
MEVNWLKKSKSKGFTLIELLIVMAVIAILIAIAIPSFRGMQNEAKKTKAQGDVRVLKIAFESYYKNHNNTYPYASTTGDNANWETPLTTAIPQILNSALYDPFGATTTTFYTLKTDQATTASAQYYVIYSIGVSGSGSALIASNGTVSASNDVVYDTNGH